MPLIYLFFIQQLINRNIYSYNIRMSVIFQETNRHDQCKKKLHQCESEYKNQIALLKQELEFLKQKLQQQQAQQSVNKRINQSIMMTYQQNQNYRTEVSFLQQQYSTKEIKRLKEQHQFQLKRIKQNNYRQIRKLQEALNQQKRKNQELLIQSDKRGVQVQRKIIQIRKDYQEQLAKFRQELSNQYSSKQEIIKEKLRQAQQLTEISMLKEIGRNKKQFITQQDPYIPFDSKNYNKSHEHQIYKNTKNIRSINSYGNFDAMTQNFVSNKQNSIQNTFISKQVTRNDHQRNMRYSSQSRNRKQRIRAIQQKNINSQCLNKASRESVKLLASRIDKAAIHLKSSSNLHHRISKKLGDR